MATREQMLKDLEFYRDNTLYDHGWSMQDIHFHMSPINAKSLFSMYRKRVELVEEAIKELKG